MAQEDQSVSIQELLKKEAKKLDLFENPRRHRVPYYYNHNDPDYWEDMGGTDMNILFGDNW